MVPWPRISSRQLNDFDDSYCRSAAGMAMATEM
jgi:hypothetical protein